MIDFARAKKLEEEAEANAGHCTHCGQTIKIYRYGISTTMISVLRSICQASEAPGATIDVEKLGLRHSERTQLTKLRFHGLIAKVKKDGHQIARRWVVTSKGWQFIGSTEIPAKVVIYNNQVLGHDGGMTTIKRVGAAASDFEQEPITEPEARTYDNVRAPRKPMIVPAVYVGREYHNLKKNGFVLTLEIDRLQIGHPVKVSVQDPKHDLEYKDIAAFKRDWKVI